MKPNLNIAEFVELWNKAESRSEFCRVTGYLPSTASSLATRYRKRGYEVKSFQTPETLALNGSKGGSTPTEKPKGFAANPELAKSAGRKGQRGYRNAIKNS